MKKDEQSSYPVGPIGGLSNDKPNDNLTIRTNIYFKIQSDIGVLASGTYLDSYQFIVLCNEFDIEKACFSNGTLYKKR